MFEVTKLVNIKMPENLASGPLENATGIIVSQLDNPAMVEVIVTSGNYIGRKLKLVKEYLTPVTI
jgi:hypothetical protein